MKCLKCGAELPDDVLFCTACGAKVTETVKPVCTQCGREFPIGTRFCGYCGIKLPFPEGEEPPFPGFGPGAPVPDFTVPGTAPDAAPAGSTEPKSPEAAPAAPPVPAGAPRPEEPKTIRELLGAFWRRRDTFRKFAFVAYVLVLILLGIALFMRNPWAITVSVLQLAGLVLALLVHMNLLHKLKSWLQYLFLVLCFLLIALNVFCWFIGGKPADASAAPEAVYTTEVPAEPTDDAAEAEAAEETQAPEEAAPEETAEVTETAAPAAVTPSGSSSAVDTTAITVPDSAESYIGTNYKTVRRALTKAGFTNITTGVVYDIVKDEYTEGDVAAISINGSTDFEKGDSFSKKDPVIITYHSSADNAPAGSSAEA